MATELIGSDQVVTDSYSPLPDVQNEKSFPSRTSMFPQCRNDADEPVLPQPRSLLLRLLRRVNSLLLD